MYNTISYYIFHTNASWTLFILRITLGIVILPHALQKLFGWFNGPGLGGELAFMKGKVGLSTFLSVTAITIECLGVFLILAGAGTRMAAVAYFLLFIGMIIFVHGRNGFFMNWFSKLPSGEEGYEFHLLVLGICIVLFFEGGGKWSVDSLIFRP